MHLMKHSAVAVYRFQLQGAGVASVRQYDLVQYDALSCVNAVVRFNTFSNCYDNSMRLQASGARVYGNTFFNAQVPKNMNERKGW